EAKLIKIDEEYSLQTRESSEWENEFRRRSTTLNGDFASINNKRAALLNGECLKTLASVRMVHGVSKTARDLKIHYGSDAPSATETRRATAEGNRDLIIRELIGTAKVFKGGGTEVLGLDLIEKVKSAAEDSLDRLFPQFREGDDARWHTVINRAKNKDGNAL